MPFIAPVGAGLAGATTIRVTRTRDCLRRMSRRRDNSHPEPAGGFHSTNALFNAPIKVRSAFIRGK
ncbi:hypothetical protein [Bradyrhizobium erythrophlei]|uniref:hypothetical protein n=1 Tax=Bradyrhizobium erythrophlei TaxID=1437360 RepID=UPI00115F792B|nr:hypothetical protein [Bradyrhizobium erythrophlei]